MLPPNRPAIARRSRRAGRPRVSEMSRAEQLRAAKRRQRQRERESGVAEVRLKLPAAQGRRLAFAARQPEFKESLERWLDEEAIEVSRHPQLQLLCWNRRSEFLTALDAWNLYERNWRFVEIGALTGEERGLIRRLGAQFGGGRVDV